MFNVSSCLRSSACAALLVVGCMPAPTEAVSTKSLLAGVVGLAALGASQAGPISGVVAYGATQVCGWFTGVVLTGLAYAAVPTVIGGAAAAATVGVTTVGVATTATAAVTTGTFIAGAVTTAVAGYGAAVQASAITVGAFFTALPFLP